MELEIYFFPPFASRFSSSLFNLLSVYLFPFSFSLPFLFSSPIYSYNLLFLFDSISRLISSFFRVFLSPFYIYILSSVFSGKPSVLFLALIYTSLLFYSLYGVFPIHLHVSWQTRYRRADWIPTAELNGANESPWAARWLAPRSSALSQATEHHH
jgi:hypothetical protein